MWAFREVTPYDSRFNFFPNERVGTQFTNADHFGSICPASEILFLPALLSTEEIVPKKTFHSESCWLSEVTSNKKK